MFSGCSSGHQSSRPASESLPLIVVPKFPGSSQVFLEYKWSFYQQGFWLALWVQGMRTSLKCCSDTIRLLYNCTLWHFVIGSASCNSQFKMVPMWEFERCPRGPALYHKKSIFLHLMDAGPAPRRLWSASRNFSLLVPGLAPSYPLRTITKLSSTKTSSWEQIFSLKETHLLLGICEARRTFLSIQDDDSQTGEGAASLTQLSLGILI